ncbi:hypothetical protein Tco_0567823 [Tanacetum coccineum]
MHLVLYVLQEHQGLLSCCHLLLLCLLAHLDLLSNKAVKLQDDSIPEENVHLSDDEDSRNDPLPKYVSRQDWWKPLPKEERHVTPELA